jgi:hypothetical protein
MALRAGLDANLQVERLAWPLRDLLRTPLLACGVLASILFVAMNVFVPLAYEGYSVAAQTVSELSAIGAPTRSLWLWLGTLYAILVAAFGCGVWAAGRTRALRIAAALLIANGVLSLFWPPMHMRGGPFTLTDTLHIVWTVATVLLMVLAISFAAAALGRRFRAYTIVTLLVLVMFGALTGIDAPRIAANLPTPWVGVWERVSIAAFMLWMIVFSVRLLRGDPAAGRRSVL